MKKTFQLTLLVMAALTLMMASCRKPKEEEKWAEAIAKTYQGYINASCANFTNQVNGNESITIAKASSNKTVNLTFTSSKWGEFSIQEAAVVLAQDTYKVNGTGICKMKMGQGGSVKEYECSVTANIKSNASDAAINFTVANVMGGLTLEFHEGKMPAAYEVAGSYEGYPTASCSFFSNSVEENQTVKLSYKADNEVSLSYTSPTWGEVTVETVKVKSENRGYSLEGTGICKMTNPHSGQQQEHPCTFTGNIAEKATMTFVVEDVMGGLTIAFHEGEMPVAFKVAGAYKGSVNVSCAFFTNSVEDNQTVNLSYRSDDEVSLSYTNATWGEFSIEAMKVNGENNNYKLEGTGICKMTNPHTGQPNEHSFTFTATITDKALMNFTVEDVMGGLKIEFDGTKRNGKELLALIF